MYSFLSFKEIASILTGSLVSTKATYILLHQYWLASTVAGITCMIAGRVAATRFLNRPTSVWHCTRDVVLHGAGTASAFGLILAPFKLLDMLFRRAHAANRVIWRHTTCGAMLLPFELEVAFAFVAYYQYNTIRNGRFFKIFTDYMVFFYAAAVVLSLYSIQRFVVWVLEHIHKVSQAMSLVLPCDYYFR